MIIARVETTNFTFEAAGNTADEARDALIAGMTLHGQQRKCAYGWFYYWLGEDNEDIKYMDLEPGFCLRDRERIIP